MSKIISFQSDDHKNTSAVVAYAMDRISVECDMEGIYIVSGTGDDAEAIYVPLEFVDSLISAIEKKRRDCEEVGGSYPNNGD